MIVRQRTWIQMHPRGLGDVTIPDCNIVGPMSPDQQAACDQLQSIKDFFFQAGQASAAPASTGSFTDFLKQHETAIFLAGLGFFGLALLKR